MFATVCSLLLYVSYCYGQTDEQIRLISSQIWDADYNRVTGTDVIYSPTGPKLFVYVNESRLTGTYALMMDMFDNYTPETGFVENCGMECINEETALLDAIMATQPMQLLHAWLVVHGLANPLEADFKNDLHQYWFMKYTRSGGPLGSSGFEHVFLGEIDEGDLKGSHNWVNYYWQEKSGNLIYQSYEATCQPEIISFGYDWLGYNKALSSAFVRTSPEAEIALYTLCLLTSLGTACPIRLDSVELEMTVWDMTGYPTTVGTAYPNCQSQPLTDEDIRVVSNQIWQSDANRITGNDVVYDENGPVLFIYVNEARFTGTYALMLDMFDNYSPDARIVELCGGTQTCHDEEEAFLNAILLTQPMQTLHTWLVGEGLASASLVDFKTELRQYWFMKYTRSGGPLGSDGFEHVFLGEIDDGQVKGSHNWVNFYYEELEGDFTYGMYQNTCPVEGSKFSFDWLGYHKSITSAMIRTSPEVEIALYTLCLLAKTGNQCPVRLNGVDTFMTTWDMSGYPKTIGSAYLNC